MSIDQNSTGLPGINVHKRTTKVNLWMIAAILIFLALTAGPSAPPVNPPLQSKPRRPSS